MSKEHAHADYRVWLMQGLMLDAEEVGAVFRVPKDTVANFHRTRQLRGVMIGKHLRWRVQDVKRFVDEMKVE